MKILFLILLVLPFLTACTTGPSKGQLDDEVRRLCAIDGGIKVYERVTLPAERFEKDGSIYIPSKQVAKLEDKFYYESFQYFFQKGNPEMWKSAYKVYRKTDNKLLGESIVYIRRGGDISGPWHESSIICPENAGTSFLMMQIFVKD